MIKPIPDSLRFAYQQARTECNVLPSNGQEFVPYRHAGLLEQACKADLKSIKELLDLVNSDSLRKQVQNSIDDMVRLQLWARESAIMPEGEC